jgi:hypothetical protein
MPYIGSNVNNRTAWDARAEAKNKGQQRVSAFYQSNANKPTTQQKVGELRNSQAQRNAQRAQNPIIPVVRTQEKNAQVNQRAAQARAERMSRMNQARNSAG